MRNFNYDGFLKIKESGRDKIPSLILNSKAVYDYAPLFQVSLDHKYESAVSFLDQVETSAFKMDPYKNKVNLHLVGFKGVSSSIPLKCSVYITMNHDNKSVRGLIWLGSSMKKHLRSGMRGSFHIRKNQEGQLILVKV